MKLKQVGQRPRRRPDPAHQQTESLLWEASLSHTTKARFQICHQGSGTTIMSIINQFEDTQPEAASVKENLLRTHSQSRFSVVSLCTDSLTDD